MYVQNYIFSKSTKFMCAMEGVSRFRERTNFSLSESVVLLSARINLSHAIQITILNVLFSDYNKTPKAIFYVYSFSCMLTRVLLSVKVNIALLTHPSIHICTLTV